MCTLVIKPEKDGNPVRDKSHIIVIGNFEDRYYTKSQRYVPVLTYSSLRLLCSKAMVTRESSNNGTVKMLSAMPGFLRMNSP